MFNEEIDGLLSMMDNSKSIEYIKPLPAPQAQASCNSAKVEKVRRPTITSARTSQEWSYFTTIWLDHVEATYVEGKESLFNFLNAVTSS